MQVLPTDMDQIACCVHCLPLKAEGGSEWISKSYRCGDTDETGSLSPMPSKYPEGQGVTKTDGQPWRGESLEQSLHSIALHTGTQSFEVSTGEPHTNIFKVNTPLAHIHVQCCKAALFLEQVRSFSPIKWSHLGSLTAL